MTAYPEKVDLNQVFRQIEPAQTSQAPHSPPAGKPSPGPWRVISADDPVGDVDPPVPDDHFSEYDAVRPANPPLQRPSSELLLSDGWPEASVELRLCRPERTPSLGAVRVVEPACDAKPRRTASPQPAGTSKPLPSPPAIPPQVSARCRDIDSQLARIIGVWHKLPQAIRAAMLAMIETLEEDR